MRFFAKLMFLCNVCFLVAAFFHYAKMYQTAGSFPQPLNFLKGTIVIVAEVGWIFNFVFVLAAGIAVLLKKTWPVPKWIYWFNAAVLVFQIYYYFFDKS
jgi:hypothetical protein